MRIGLLAQEAFDESGTNTNDPLSVAHLDADETITLEAAALILADSAELAGSIRYDLRETERLIQLSYALEELCLIAKDIEAATPAETRLLMVAGDMAVAGSDVEPDDVVPAMEAYVGHAIAQESLDTVVASAKKIWEFILNAVRRVWTKIHNFYRAAVVIPKYKSVIEELKTELSKAGQIHEEKKTFSVAGVSHGLMIDISTPESWHHLLEELKRFERIDQTVFKSYASKVLEKGAEIVKAINEFDPKVPEKSAERLKEKLLSVNESDEGLTEPFLGAGKLEMHKYEKLNSEDAAIALERLRLSGLKYSKHGVAESIEHGKEALKNVPAPTLAEIGEILSGAETLLNTLEEFYAQHAGQFDKTAKELETASNKATTEMSKLDKAEFSNRSLDAYRSLLNFNKAFADWSSEPFVSMFQHTVRVVQSLSALSKGALSCYQSK